MVYNERVYRLIYQFVEKAIWYGSFVCLILVAVVSVSVTRWWSLFSKKTYIHTEFGRYFVTNWDVPFSNTLYASLIDEADTYRTDHSTNIQRKNEQRRKKKVLGQPWNQLRLRAKRKKKRHK